MKEQKKVERAFGSQFRSDSSEDEDKKGGQNSISLYARWLAGNNPSETWLQGKHDGEPREAVAGTLTFVTHSRSSKQLCSYQCTLAERVS